MPQLQYNPYGGLGNSYATNYVPQPVYIPATKQQAQNIQQTMPYYSLPPDRPLGLRGRVINNPDEITPQEVPMDGGYSLFPMTDNSAVYMKAWTPDGKISTFKFIPESIELPVDQTPDTSSIILERLETIENMLKQRNSRQKRSNEEEHHE